MSRLTRDGTAEPVSRGQILRHARGQGNIIFPVQLTTSRIGNLTGLIHTLLYVMTIHTYIQYSPPSHMVVVIYITKAINWSVGIPENAAPVTRTLRFTGPVPTDSWQ